MRTFTSIVVVTVLLTLVGYMPIPQAQAAEAGDLIKCSDFTAVYYLAEDGTRWVFPNDKTFFTWYDNFDDVVEITCEELGDISIGSLITYQAGTRMVKIQSIPKVYAVEPGGALRWIETEEIAEDLYGSNWASRIDDVSDGFWTSYEEGDPLGSSIFPLGTMFKSTYSGLYYYQTDYNELARVDSSLLSVALKEYALNATHTFIDARMQGQLTENSWQNTQQIDDYPETFVITQLNQQDQDEEEVVEEVAEETCSQDADCEADQYCYDNACYDKLANGESCSGYDNWCLSGGCDFTTCDDVCSVDSDCLNTEYCSGGFCEDKKEAGSLCLGDEYCLSDNCTNNVCVACSQDVDCGANQYCYDSACYDQLDNGESCSGYDNWCLSGGCNFTTCDDVCTDNSDCLDTEYCGGGFCEDRYENGHMCLSDKYCLSDDCTGNVCVGALGSSCTDGGDCASGYCYDSVCYELTLRATCGDNSDCYGDQTCIASTCVNPIGGWCYDDLDCSTYVCNEGTSECESWF